MNDNKVDFEKVEAYKGLELILNYILVRLTVLMIIASVIAIIFG